MYARGARAMHIHTGYLHVGARGKFCFVSGILASWPCLPCPQADYRIACTLVDYAICDGHNVGFSHWRSSMRGIVHGGEGEAAIVDTDEYVIEAMAVHAFKEDGKMVDTWLLRWASGRGP